jgi:AcrR family transcriptional regulator
MRLTLSPVRSDAVLYLHRAGDVLTINGEAFDLGDVDEGDVLPRAAIDCPWIIDDVTRTGGALQLRMALPHGAGAGSGALFPAAIDPVPSGAVTLPGRSDPVPEPVGAGSITWAQKRTAAQAAADKLEAWRATAKLSRAEFLMAAVSAGLLTATEARAIEVPASFEALVAALSEPSRTGARIRWASEGEFDRLDPLLAAVIAAADIPPAVVDAMFGWT